MLERFPEVREEFQKEIDKRYDQNRAIAEVGETADVGGPYVADICLFAEVELDSNVVRLGNGVLGVST